MANPINWQSRIGQAYASLTGSPVEEAAGVSSWIDSILGLTPRNYMRNPLVLGGGKFNLSAEASQAVEEFFVLRKTWANFQDVAGRNFLMMHGDPSGKVWFNKLPFEPKEAISLIQSQEKALQVKDLYLINCFGGNTEAFETEFGRIIPVHGYKTSISFLGKDMDVLKYGGEWEIVPKVGGAEITPQEAIHGWGDPYKAAAARTPINPKQPAAPPPTKRSGGRKTAKSNKYQRKDENYAKGVGQRQKMNAGGGIPPGGGGLPPTGGPPLPPTGPPIPPATPPTGGGPKGIQWTTEQAADKIFYKKGIVRNTADLDDLLTFLNDNPTIVVDTEFATAISEGRIAKQVVSMQFSAPAKPGELAKGFFLPINYFDSEGKIAFPDLTDDSITAMLSKVKGDKTWVLQNAAADVDKLEQYGLKVTSPGSKVIDTMLTARVLGEPAGLKTYGYLEHGWDKPDLGKLLEMMRKGEIGPGGVIPPGKFGIPYLPLSEFSTYAVEDVIFTQLMSEQFQRLAPSQQERLMAFSTAAMERASRQIVDPLYDIQRDIGRSPDWEARIEEYLIRFKEKPRTAIPYSFYKSSPGWLRQQGKILDVTARSMISEEEAASIAALRQTADLADRSARLPKMITREEIANIRAGGIKGLRGTISEWMSGWRERVLTPPEHAMHKYARLGMPTKENLAPLGLTDDEIELWNIIRSNAKAPPWIQPKLNAAGELIDSPGNWLRNMQYGATMQMSLPKVDLAEGAVEAIKAEFQAMAVRQLDEAVKTGGVMANPREYARHLDFFMKKAYWSVTEDEAAREIGNLSRAAEEMSKLMSSGAGARELDAVRSDYIRSVESFMEKGIRKAVWTKAPDLEAMRIYNKMVGDEVIGPGTPIIIDLKSLPAKLADDSETIMLNAFVREGAAEGEAIGIGRFSYPKQAFGKLQELSKKHNYLYQYLTDVSEGTPLAEKPADLLGEARRFTEAVGTAQKVKLGEANFLTSEMAWPKGRGTIPLVAESPLIQRLSTRAGELGRIISKLGAETTYDDVVGAVSKNTGFMSILDDIGQKAYSSGVISAQMGLPIAAAALILGVGAAKMISDRREDEAWRMPSKLFGKYEQPGAVMMENRNSVAAEMSPPVPQKRRMDRQSIWDTSDIITILGLNRTRHYNMDSARNSFLYGGMAGRV